GGPAADAATAPERHKHCLMSRVRRSSWLAEEGGPGDQRVLSSCMHVSPVVAGPDERGSAGGEGDLAVEVAMTGAAGGGQRSGQAGHGPGAGGQLGVADSHGGGAGALR